MDYIKVEDFFRGGGGVMWYRLMLHFKKGDFKFSLSEIISEMLVWFSAEV
jgi:hypothetical protein